MQIFIMIMWINESCLKDGNNREIKLNLKKLESGKSAIVQTRPSTRFVENYNLLTLNSLTLGYDFPQRLLKKVGFGMLRFEVATNDLARFCTVKQERGLSYPYAQTVNFSLKATF